MFSLVVNMIDAVRKYFGLRKVDDSPIEAPVMIAVPTQAVTKSPDYNERLYEHFSGLLIKQYTPARLFHGGTHLPGAPVKGSLWMHDNHSDASPYKDWGKPNNAALLPVVLEAEPVKPLNLIEFIGNHIEILQDVYEGAWSHTKFHKDFIQLVERGLLQCDGFYRPRSDEYFILNVEDNLKFL